MSPAPPAWRGALSIGPDHPALPGHFPAEPVVPGVLLLDEVLHLLRGQADRWRVDHVKFHHLVRPLDALTLQAWRQADGTFSFEVRGGQHLVASGVLVAQTGAA